ncbi:MAG: type II secretion system protein GspD [Spirochaetes bacterium]|nr:MAG: type II secretion system protein GspD [Spirochaetota bacterium]
MKKPFACGRIALIAITMILCAGPWPAVFPQQPDETKESRPAEEETKPAEKPVDKPAGDDTSVKKVQVETVQKTAQPADAAKKDEKAAAQKAPDQTKYFTLNFKDVEISEFLTIMSQLIEKNIIIDEKVKGKISITSAKRIPVDQAYDIMKSILEVKGFAIVESENMIKVLPIKEAIRKNVEVLIDEKKKLPAETDKTITYLLDVEYASVNEIANVLKALKSANTEIVVYAPLNTVIFTGTSSEINGLVQVARQLDRKIDELKDDKAKHGNIHVVHLENADAEQLGAVLARIPFSDAAKIDTSPLHTEQPQADERKPGEAKPKPVTVQPGQQKTQAKLSIVANKETNSLIITATQEEFNEIKRVIKELDIVREQVLIEALIVEVSAENGWGLGIDWMLGGQAGSNLFGGSSIMGGVPSYSVPTGLTGKKIAVPLATGLQLGYLSDTDMLGFVLLNATGTDKNFNILSTPQILTIDNQEAELNVGEEIPVPTNNRISDTGVAFYTFEYKSVGVKLKITPHITKADQITLDLYQEVNSVLGATTTTSTGAVIPPSLGKRDIKTKITVHDGKTIVVGGLIRNNKNVEETKVPVLGDIPLLGWFFKRKNVSYSKTNLLVFITPHLLTKQDRMDAITEQKREEQRRIRGN